MLPLKGYSLVHNNTKYHNKVKPKLHKCLIILRANLYKTTNEYIDP